MSDEIVKRLDKLQLDMTRNCEVSTRAAADAAEIKKCLLGDVTKPQELGLLPRVDTLEKGYTRMMRGFMALLTGFLAAGGKMLWDFVTKRGA